MRVQQGTGLLELMAVLGICAIVLLIAAPSYQQMVERNHHSQQVNQLLGVLHYARSQAVQQRSQVTLCPGAQQCEASAQWSKQLLMFIDRNSNGQWDGQEQQLQKVYLDESIHWQWSGALNKGFLTFQADGASRGLNGTLTLCQKEQPKQQVVVALSGRIRSQNPGASARCH